MADMLGVPPLGVNDTTLTSSNVPENDYAEWNSATSYVIGDRVIVLATHRIYEAQVANTNKYPPDYLDDGDPDADPPVLDTWLEVSATNRYRMFDGKARSITAQATSIIVEITPGELFNTVAALNIKGESANVQVIDPSEGTVYDRDIDLLDLSGIDDFYDWFWSPLEKKTNFVLTDLPAFPLAKVKLTILNSSEDAEIGEFVVGRARNLGISLYPSTVGIANYNRKAEDGDSIEVRAFAKLVDFKILMQTNRVDAIQEFLSGYTELPLVYIGSELNTSMVVYGFFKDFRIQISDLNTSSCNLQVEELG